MQLFSRGQVWPAPSRSRSRKNRAVPSDNSLQLAHKVRPGAVSGGGVVVGAQLE